MQGIIKNAIIPNQGGIDMDLTNIIEEYIKVGSRYDYLRKLITNAENNYFYAKTKGDIAFGNGEYELEESYNESARYSIEAKKTYGTELALLEELLLQLLQSYYSVLSSKKPEELVSIKHYLFTKKEELEKEKLNLENKMNAAKVRGDEAYKNGNIEEELKHNEVSTNCFLEIEKVSTRIEYYNSFVNDIEKYIKKSNQIKK